MLKEKAIIDCNNIDLKGMLGIFGNPIAHTLSPVIHDNLSYIYENNEKYIPFKIEDDLDKYVKDAYDNGVLGLNITVPHKQEVMGTLVDIDEDAKCIGAVNTLVRVDGGYKGYNTDMPGLARAISSEGISLKDKRVIMLGAGGAARAVAYMCGKFGCKSLFVINRSVDKARLLCEEMKGIFDSCEYKAFTASDYKLIPDDKYLFIQSTSVGLHENDGIPLVSDESFYDMAFAGVDLIYNPAETPFLKLLRNKGIKAFNGLKMLLYQGILAYELWNKISIDDEVADCIYKMLCYRLYGKANTDRIVLIGYMGSGKTTVGKKLADKLGCSFVDTDEYIVNKEGRSIAEIFEKNGEEYFRQLETAILDEIKTKYSKCVISTGGGMPMRKENRDKLSMMGKVYYLNASADIIYERVKDSTDRPLLNGDDLYNKVVKMLGQRNKNYCLCADKIINANDTIDNIISEII